jgi:hypothetical protein
VNRHPHSQDKRSTQPLAISSEWHSGPRTPAWDRLWRIILSDSDPEPVRPDAQQRGRGDEGG